MKKNRVDKLYERFLNGDLTKAEFEEESKDLTSNFQGELKGVSNYFYYIGQLNENEFAPVLQDQLDTKIQGQSRSDKKRWTYSIAASITALLISLSIYLINTSYEQPEIYVISDKQEALKITQMALSSIAKSYELSYATLNQAADISSPINKFSILEKSSK